MKASDFAQPSGLKDDRGETFRFGIAPGESCAAALRRFADQIEQQRIYVQQVRMIERANPEDFVASTLILRFVEKS